MLSLKEDYSDAVAGERARRRYTNEMRNIEAASMFGGAYVVDDFALVLKGLFLVAGYLTILLSTNAIAEGDYHEGEYYLLLVSSVIGMVVMSSARDLITIFVALEMLSIPAYLLASWRKRTKTGIEGGMKYYLMGVFASAVMLYGMSLVYGGTGTTLLAGIGAQIDGAFGDTPVAALGIVFGDIGTKVRYYEADDSVFVDGEYLIKGLPGRILWLLLTIRQREGRDTFLNRELRLHPLLKLPSYKDNLEARLLMLQRRLEDKGTALRIAREQRGRLRLSCAKQVELEHTPA